MKEGKIPFNNWSKERIAQGKKSCTSRHKRYLHDSRVTYISPKLPLWFIKQYLWAVEGADSPQELQKVFNSIYKREVSKSEEFFVHFGNFEDETPFVAEKKEEK